MEEDKDTKELAEAIKILGNLITRAPINVALNDILKEMKELNKNLKAISERSNIVR